jgi:hypothetical protein
MRHPDLIGRTPPESRIHRVRRFSSARPPSTALCTEETGKPRNAPALQARRQWETARMAENGVAPPEKPSWTQGRKLAAGNVVIPCGFDSGALEKRV